MGARFESNSFPKKCAMSRSFGSMNNNSSVNEMLDDPKVRKLSEEYAAALKDAVTGSEAANVIGVVIVLNDALEEVDVYPNHNVLQRMYPRLVLSYALYAAMLKGEAEKDRSPQTAQSVALFLEAQNEKSRREKTIDTNNLLEIRTLNDDRFQCSTTYNGKVVHWQIMTKIGGESEGSGSASGSSSGSARSRLFGSRY
jgi:hypothetical protein